MKSPQKELVADGNRRKPPRSLHAISPSTVSSNVSEKDIDHNEFVRPLSVASSDTMTLEMDDDGTSTASNESFTQQYDEESSSNEGKQNVVMKIQKFSFSKME